MVGEKFSLDTLVFGLAILGYTGLGVCTVLHGLRKRTLAVSGLTALVVTAHVLGVWAHRFGWSLDEATQNGWRGFVLFHLAYLLIVLAPFLPKRSAMLTPLAFVIVSGGAIGAAFRYEVVAWLRMPVLLVACATLMGAGLAHYRTWRDQRAV